MHNFRLEITLAEYQNVGGGAVLPLRQKKDLIKSHQDDYRQRNKQCRYSKDFKAYDQQPSGCKTLKTYLQGVIHAPRVSCRCLMYPNGGYNKSICADAGSRMASDRPGKYSSGALTGIGRSEQRCRPPAQRETPLTLIITPDSRSHGDCIAAILQGSARPWNRLILG